MEETEDVFVFFLWDVISDANDELYPLPISTFKYINVSASPQEFS